MSQGPPVDARNLTPASITTLAPETLAAILSFAAYERRWDDELEVYSEDVSTNTLECISLVCKHWRDCANPLHFQTPYITYSPHMPCEALKSFQLNPSLKDHVHSLRLSLYYPPIESDSDSDAEDVLPVLIKPAQEAENWLPLIEWMGSLKNLTYLRLHLSKIPRDSYAAWPLDAFPRVAALYSSTHADSFFNQALISRMPHLKALFLATGGYSCRPDLAAQHLVAVEALPNARCLTHLFFFKGDITSSAFRHLVHTSGATLKVLEVYKAYNLDDEDLAFAIGSAPKLRRVQWCNERDQRVARFLTIRPHPPALLRALSTSHITNLDIRPWPTLDVIEAFPDTLVELGLGTIQDYPGRRRHWALGGDPLGDMVGREGKEVLDATFTAVLDARVAGRFPRLTKCYDMMGDLEGMSANVKKRALREGLAWYMGKAARS